MKRGAWLWIPALVLGFGLSLPGAAQSPASLKSVIAARFPDVRWIDTATLARWRARRAGERPVVLDARTKAEFDVSHLHGARRVDPDEPRVDSLHIPSDATVVVYCSVGYRSADIAQRLQRAGIRKVYNLEGGIFAWANEGRPIYRGGKRVKQVHPYDQIWGRFLREDLRAPLPKAP